MSIFSSRKRRSIEQMRKVLEPYVKSASFNAQTLHALMLSETLNKEGRVGASYGSLARLGYAGTVAAFRAINDIAASASSVPLDVYVGGAKRDDHPVARLLRRPSPRTSFRAMMRGLYSAYHISGNGLLQILEFGGRPVAIVHTRPDDVVEVSRSGPTRTTYRFAGPTRPALVVDDTAPRSPLLHLKTFNPRDPLWGLSPLEPARNAIDRHRAADEWNVSLMQNSGKPSGGFKVESSSDGDANLTTEQRDLLREQILELFSGAENVGLPLILEGGLTWQKYGMTPVEADWLQGKNSAARDIANALNYPPMLLALPGDNTFSNQREARLALWEEKVIPLVMEFADELSQWLAPHFGAAGQLQLRPNFNGVSALALKRERIWDRIKNSSFMSVNESRSEVGLDQRPEKEADLVLTQAQLVPLEFAAIPRSANDLQTSIAINRGQSPTGPSPDAATPADSSQAAPDTGSGTATAANDGSGSTPQGVAAAQSELPNGAQVIAALDVIGRVSAGDLPKPSAQVILESMFGLEPDRARAILAPIIEGSTAPPQSDSTPASGNNSQ